MRKNRGIGDNVKKLKNCNSILGVYLINEVHRFFLGKSEKKRNNTCGNWFKIMI